MLETLGQTNIGHLNLEEPLPKPTGLFDIQRDIHSNFRDLLANNIKGITNTDVWSWEHLAAIFFTQRILFPEDMNINLITAEKIREIQNVLSQRKNAGGVPDTLGYLARAYRFKIAFPFLTAKNLGLGAKRKSLKKTIDSQKQTGPAQELADLFAPIQIIAPELIDQTKIEGLKESMAVRIKSSFQEGGWSFSYFLNRLFYFRILFPNEDISQFQTPIAFSRLKYFLNGTVGIDTNLTPLYESIRQYGLTASYMRILSAKKVNLTDQGLELTFPEVQPNFETTPPLPEMRKF
ncbi:MAG: hypothetical protein Q7R49_01685 [Candidatus Daviesbacteria bacterium]|nr:hypothetical protein [Candidatus Daviesbacteria bacterium]